MRSETDTPRSLRDLELEGDAQGREWLRRKLEEKLPVEAHRPGGVYPPSGRKAWQRQRRPSWRPWWTGWGLERRRKPDRAGGRRLPPSRRRTGRPVPWEGGCGIAAQCGFGGRVGGSRKRRNPAWKGLKSGWGCSIGRSRRWRPSRGNWRKTGWWASKGNGGICSTLFPATTMTSIGRIRTLPPRAAGRNAGRGRLANPQPGRRRYVAQASSPASSGSVPLPVGWQCRYAP
jgi:hypothetical protein